MNGSRRLSALLLVGFAASSCIPSNVVAREERMVIADLTQLDWQPAPDLRLDGLFETVEITGQAAASLRKVWYLFLADGNYTAAALTEIDGEYAFQTIGGTWQNGADGLVLDDNAPVALSQSGEHLRIASDGGSIVLLQKDGWR